MIVAISRAPDAALGASIEAAHDEGSVPLRWAVTWSLDGEATALDIWRGVTIEDAPGASVLSPTERERVKKLLADRDDVEQ